MATKEEMLEWFSYYSKYDQETVGLIYLCTGNLSDTFDLLTIFRNSKVDKKGIEFMIDLYKMSDSKLGFYQTVIRCYADTLKTNFPNLNNYIQTHGTPIPELNQKQLKFINENYPAFKIWKINKSKPESLGFEFDILRDDELEEYLTSTDKNLVNIQSILAEVETNARKKSNI